MARPAICLECRTLLGAGELCDLHPRGGVVSLATTDGANALRAATFVERYQPPQPSERAPAGEPNDDLTIASVVAAVAAGVVLLVVPAGRYVAPLIAVGVFACVLFGLSARRGVRNTTSKTTPPVRLGVRGVVNVSAVPPSARGLVGVVTAEQLVSSALTGAPCAAFDAAVMCGSDVLLRDGACAALLVQLETGGHVVVPAGRARVEGAGSAASDGALRTFLRLRAPVLADERRWEPSDAAAHEVLVGAGARVELFADCDTEAVPDADASSPYRGVSATRRIVRGIPVIRLLDQP